MALPVAGATPRRSAKIYSLSPINTVKFTHPYFCISLLSCSFLLVGIGHSGEVSSITSTFEGASAPIGGSGTFEYNLTTTLPTENVTSIAFESRFRFYSKFVAGGGPAQLFRPNLNYSIGFQVSDPDQIGYRIKIHRRIIGLSSISLTGPNGAYSSNGSVNYNTGLVYVNDTLETDLVAGNFVSREVSETNPTPADVSHRVDRFLTLSDYKGTQAFTINEYEPAAQIVNVFQNYNIGSAELFFGLVPNLSTYSNSPDESGDSFIVTVIFNPTCSIQQQTATTSSISFTGILQESNDFKEWVDVSPQPVSPVQINTSNGARFFRSRTLE